MSLKLKLTGISFVAVMFAINAQAAPLVVGDNVDVAALTGGGDIGYSGVNFANRETNGRYWGDEINTTGQRFDTTQITVNRDNNANRLSITLRTMFDGTGPSSYADLYFDTRTPGALDDFGYSIALGTQTQAAGVYAVSQSATANELWFETGDIYGGYAQLNPSAPGYNPNASVLQYVSLQDGLKFDGYDVTTSSTDVGNGFFDLLVQISSPFGMSLFDNFDLFWATSDSGSDSIWGSFATVPAPGAATLFGLGIVAVAAARRRRKA